MHQEEELRREEEAYYQAKREAARIAKVLRRKEQQVAKLASSSRKDANTWLGEDDSDWEMWVLWIDFMKTTCAVINSADKKDNVTFVYLNSF